MPISPDEAKQLTENDKVKLGRYLEDIDKQLWQKFVGTTVQITFIDLGLSSTDVKLVTAIKEAYQRVGWNVVVKNDQRDGDWFEFSGLNT